MDNSITIGANSFALTSQQPTGNVRTGLVGGLTTRVITAHQSVTPKGGASVVRTTRKVEQVISSTIGGVVVALPVTAAVTFVVPDALPASSVDAVIGILKEWLAQAGFLAEVKTNQI